jgi:hypothetical protein
MKVIHDTLIMNRNPERTTKIGYTTTMVVKPIMKKPPIISTNIHGG